MSSINIHINSGGGSVFGGIAIYNMLKRNSAQKTVYIDGIAASIASVIAMAGDRIIVPANATMMIHKPSNSYFLQVKMQMNFAKMLILWTDARKQSFRLT